MPGRENMIYRCRNLVPHVSDWMDVEGSSVEGAAGTFHEQGDNDRRVKSLWYDHRTDRGLVRVGFIRMEIEGHGAMISRRFHHGIWRKGGAPRIEAPILADIGRQLEWHADPKELLAEGWVGEESLEDALARQ